MRVRRSLAAAACVALAAGAWLVAGGGPATPPDHEPVVTRSGGTPCDLPGRWLELIRRGRYPGRSGDIVVLPKTPAYFASGGGGWSHSGPWPHLQRVPLVFYGPGLLPPARGDGRATLADVAPTLGRVLRFSHEGDGRVLDDVAGRARRAPRLILTIVLDGGGWNTLEQWPEAWPNLRRMIRGGVSFDDAIVGSSPSVTPAVHTTLGTGTFPARHGVTSVVMRDGAEVVDSFLEGESARFINVPTLAERWDEAHGNRALVGMVAYEPWHLGMIGKGAEAEGGDLDHAAWISDDTSLWTTNPVHYELPQGFTRVRGLAEEIERLDAADGRADGRWRDNDFLAQPGRLEQTPAFAHLHGRMLRSMIRAEGYGDDRVADLLYTNFKQMDILGHYFNMASAEVRDALRAADVELGRTASFLDREVGRGRWLVVVSADHGQQPDASFVRGFGIEPTEVEDDLEAAFGPIEASAWPTEIFLRRDALQAGGYDLDDVAEFLRTYTVADNAGDPRVRAEGTGVFGADEPVFAFAEPGEAFDALVCPSEPPPAG